MPDARSRPGSSACARGCGPCRGLARLLAVATPAADRRRGEDGSRPAAAVPGARSTWWSSRSTRRAPTGSAATASAASRRRTSTPSRARASSSSTRRPRCRSPSRRTPRSSPGSCRPTTASATTAASSSTQEKVTLAERLQRGRLRDRAPSSARGCSTRKWGLGQGFDEYSDDFDLSKYKVVSLGTVQKPGDEVMDERARLARHGARAALLRLGPPLRPAHALRAARAVRLALPGPAVPRRDRLHRPGGRPAHRRGCASSGLCERTLVVLTGDHGESLGDHGESTHAYFVYDATTHVPLVVRTPWGVRGRRSLQVSSVDLMPTRARPRRPRAPARRSTATRSRGAILDPRRERRADRLLGDLLPALPLRLAAPARRAHAAVQVHRRARAGALRPARRTRARRRTSTRPSRGAPRTLRLRMEELREERRRRGARAAQPRPRDAAAARGARLRRQRDRRGPERGAARPEAEAAALRDDERGQAASPRRRTGSRRRSRRCAR